MKVACLVDRDSTLTIPGVGEFKGQIEIKRYENLIERYPTLKGQFEVVEVAEEEPKKAKAADKA